MRVTEGVRKIIVEWHGKGVPPEETARSLRIPIDEVKAIILQAHPAGTHGAAAQAVRTAGHAGNGGEANKKPPPCGRGIALSKRQV